MFQTPDLTQSIRRRRIVTQRTHTPASFAAARRLRFSAAGSGPTTPAANDRRTPWGEPTIPSMTAVFKSTPKFDPPPVGGNTEAATHWKTKVDLFLRSNRFVRDMLDGRRPHPWVSHAKLQALGNRRTPGWTFSSSTTTSTLEWVAKQDEDLAAELDELLHFGDIVSWASLNEAIYTTVYGTLKADQRYLISGVERHDGITARQRIFEALSDPDSTEQARLYKYATKIRRQEIVPGPDPLGTYFGRIQSYWHNTAPAPVEPPAVPEADVVDTRCINS